MSKEEVKNDINKVLDHLSDKTLQDVLSFLKKIEGKTNPSIVDETTINKILIEDRGLLEKLANDTRKGS